MDLRRWAGEGARRNDNAFCRCLQYGGAERPKLQGIVGVQGGRRLMSPYVGDCVIRKANIAIKPPISNSEIVAAIVFALGLSFHDRRP